LEVSISPPARRRQFRGHAFTCSIREPGPDSCCLYAGPHLSSKRVTPRLIPGFFGDPGFGCHLMSFRRFRRQRAHPIAHLPGPYLTRSQPRLFPHRSTPQSSAKAPVGDLKPPPRKATSEDQNPSIYSYSTAISQSHSTHLSRSCSQPKTSSMSCDLGVFVDDAAKAITPTDFELI
jgi:hypothetical protein